MNQKHKLFLERTVSLAQAGFRKASLQPLIGWLITQQDTILAEGWMEPNQSYEDQLQLLLSTISIQTNTQLYINTNPFDKNILHHFADQYKVSKIFIADETPNLSSSLWYVNRRSYVFQQYKRPYIVLKWAQTQDGFVARSNFDSKWISGPHARKLVHQWRAQESAIWVGNNTYRHDNPQLNVRDWVGENPVRIVVDPQQSLDSTLHVFDQSQPTLYYTQKKLANRPNLEFTRLPDEDRWEMLIPYVLSDLYQRQVVSVFVEGGAQLLSFLLEHHWWDEARVFVADKMFETGIAAPSIGEKYLVTKEMVSEDQLLIYHRFISEAKEKVEK